MAKTNAERQRARQARLQADRDWRRLNLWIRADAHGALRRLAARERVTLAEAIERLALRADGEILSAMTSQEETDAYFRESVAYETAAHRRQPGPAPDDANGEDPSA